MPLETILQWMESCYPDLNPIEQVFAELKQLLRISAKGTTYEPCMRSMIGQPAVKSHFCRIISKGAQLFQSPAILRSGNSMVGQSSGSKTNSGTTTSQSSHLMLP